MTRKIETTVEGIDHPMFDRRSGSFDATSEHGDAVTGLPPGGKRLAGNDACDVQAAAFQMNGSEVWGTQYHPDIDLPQSRSIAAELRDVLIAEGYFESIDDFDAHVTRLDRLVADPDSKDARWQLGVDDDILKLERQYAEVVCWLEHLIL